MCVYVSVCVSIYILLLLLSAIIARCTHVVEVALFQCFLLLYGVPLYKLPTNFPLCCSASLGCFHPRAGESRAVGMCGYSCPSVCVRGVCVDVPVNGTAGSEA